MQYQVILISFAGNAQLYVLIFKIIWVAPTLGPVSIPLCSTILLKNIHQYSQSNAFHSLFHKQTYHKNICTTGIVDSNVQRGILRCISSPELYFYSVHFESIFQLMSPNEPAPYMPVSPTINSPNSQAAFGSWDRVAAVDQWKAGSHPFLMTWPIHRNRKTHLTFPLQQLRGLIAHCCEPTLFS